MKKNDSALGIGVVTIFSVMVVLCLAVFAMLTLSSAGADMRLSRANADYVSAYYAADLEAHRDYEAFVRSEEESLEMEIYITDTQSLYLSLKKSGGEVEILQWGTIPVEGVEIDNTLDLWDGTFSE